MAATLPGTLPGTLPSANYQPAYRSNGACDDLAELVAPYSLSRAQLAEATGIADEATVNGWVEQCCPDLAADAPVPLEPVLRYLDETYLPDPANWPGTNPYDEFILENIAARMLARVVADTFGADRSDSYRELLALIATLVLIARYWDAPEETFLTLLNAEPTAEAGGYLQEAIANAPESLYPLLTELLLPPPPSPPLTVPSAGGAVPPPAHPSTATPWRPSPRPCRCSTPSPTPPCRRSPPAWSATSAGMSFATGRTCPTRPPTT